jgi:hypothetical protein
VYRTHTYSESLEAFTWVRAARTVLWQGSVGNRRPYDDRMADPDRYFFFAFAVDGTAGSNR